MDSYKKKEQQFQQWKKTQNPICASPKTSEVIKNFNRSQSTSYFDSPRSNKESLSPQMDKIKSQSRSRLPSIDKDLQFNIKVKPQHRFVSSKNVVYTTKFILPTVIQEEDGGDNQYSFRNLNQTFEEHRRNSTLQHSPNKSYSLKKNQKGSVKDFIQNRRNTDSFNHSKVLDYFQVQMKMEIDKRGQKIQAQEVVLEEEWTMKEEKRVKSLPKISQIFRQKQIDEEQTLKLFQTSQSIQTNINRAPKFHNIFIRRNCDLQKVDTQWRNQANPLYAQLLKKLEEKDYTILKNRKHAKQILVDTLSKRSERKAISVLQ